MNQSRALYTKLASLPQPTAELLIENQKLKRQMMILEAQLSEKSQVIVQLKRQLDNSVVEQTQQRLCLAREIQNKVEDQVIKIRQSFYEKSLAMQDQIQTLRTMVQELKKDLSSSYTENEGYRSKIQSLKQYILDIVEEKDEIINELSMIIQQQEQQKKTVKESKEQRFGQSNRAKKKAVIIKNQ